MEIRKPSKRTHIIVLVLLALAIAICFGYLARVGPNPLRPNPLGLAPAGHFRAVSRETITYGDGRDWYVFTFKDTKTGHCYVGAVNGLVRDDEACQ